MWERRSRDWGSTVWYSSSIPSVNDGFIAIPRCQAGTRRQRDPNSIAQRAGGSARWPLAARYNSVSEGAGHAYSENRENLAQLKVHPLGRRQASLHTARGELRFLCI